MASLSAKQLLFIQEYLKDLHAGKAAERAGYSAKTAAKIGSENLQKPEIKQALKFAIDERAAKAGISAKRVVEEIMHMALIDVTDLSSVKKPEDLRKLPEHVRRAIVGWSWSAQGKFQPKTAKEKSIEMLCRHLGLFEDEDRGKSNQELLDALKQLDDEERAAKPMVINPQKEKQDGIEEGEGEGKDGDIRTGDDPDPDASEQ